MKKLIPISVFLVAASSLLLMPISQAADAKNETAKKTAKPTAATTPRYKMVAGMGTGVCEAYLKHLNALPKEEPSLTCEVKFSPQFKDFSEPQWEALDWKAHLDWIHAIELLLSGPNEAGYILRKQTYADWEKSYLDRISKEHLNPRLRRTKVALNERGEETLIAYDRDTDGCERARKQKWELEGGSRYFVMYEGTPPQFDVVLGSGGTAYPSHLRLFRDKGFFMRIYPEDWSMHIESVFADLPPKLMAQKLNPKQYVIKDVCRYVLNPK